MGFAAGMQMAGTVTSAIGAYQAASSQKSLLDAAGDISEVNARLSEASARAELRAGEQRKGAVQMQTARLKGAQRAAQAANGVDLGVGSAAEVQTSTDTLGEIDANTVAYNALRSAWGYRMQGVNFKNDALMRHAQADGISPALSAATSLLGGAGQLASSWYGNGSLPGMGSTYNYNNDASAWKFSASGADIRGRR